MYPREFPPQTDTRFTCAKSLHRLPVMQVDMARPSLVGVVRTTVPHGPPALCAHPAQVRWLDAPSRPPAPPTLRTMFK